MQNENLISMSLDLDNLWSYLKIHGDHWETYPSYFPIAIPRILDILQEYDWKITFFVVGQDAAIDSNVSWLRKISEAHHELGNHSFHHEPWMQFLSEEDILQEL